MNALAVYVEVADELDRLAARLARIAGEAWERDELEAWEAARRARDRLVLAREEIVTTV